MPESEILAFEATHRLKAGILARIFLIFFRCAAVLAAQQRRDASAKTGFKANGWSLVRNRDSPSSRGGGGGGGVATGELTNRAKDTFNIVPRRHHLSWCNFRDQRETRRNLAVWNTNKEWRRTGQEGHGRGQRSGGSQTQQSHVLSPPRLLENETGSKRNASNGLFPAPVWCRRAAKMPFAVPFIDRCVSCKHSFNCLLRPRSPSFRTASRSSWKTASSADMKLPSLKLQTLRQQPTPPPPSE